jgi:hypothetical protein
MGALATSRKGVCACSYVGASPVSGGTGGGGEAKEGGV